MKQNSSNSLAMPLDKQQSPFVYTDEQLIARFQSGDERAYIELVNRFKDRLINFVYPFCFCVELIAIHYILRLHPAKSDGNPGHKCKNE